MKIEDIERLIELVARNEIGSLELKTGGMEVRITKAEGRASLVEVAAPVVRTAAGHPGPPQGLPPMPEAAAAAAVAEIEEQEGITIMRSTMVGTFYRAPAPGAEPFVQVGQSVRKGQVICIIEAMKIMNEIESELSGEVVKQFVEDAQPVEYGEPLFAIRTS